VLETTDPLKTGPNEAQLTILSGVPLDIGHNFGHDQIRGSTTSGGSVAHTTTGRRQSIINKNPETVTLIQPSALAIGSHFAPKHSTADSLFNLTADVLKLQQNAMVGSGATGSGNDNIPHRAIMIEEGLGTSADAFANTAARLMQRQYASCYKIVSPTKKDHTPIQTSPGTAPSPSTPTLRNSLANQKVNGNNDTTSTNNSSTKHWNTIKKSVLTTRVDNENKDVNHDMDPTENTIDDAHVMSKPDQSPCDPETGMGSSSAMSSSSNLRKKKRGKLELARGQLQSSAYEFKEWAIDKRSAVEFLLKSIACIIVILIGISAL
jgi:hypothetical protein